MTYKFTGQHIPEHSDNSHINNTHFLNDLKSRSSFQLNEDNNRKKQEIINWLQNKVIRFIQSIREKLTIPAPKTEGHLLSFGSYRLGVYNPGNDLDTICVAPRYVDREAHFFGVFLHMLAEDSEVKQIRAIKKASVPLIKFVYMNVSVDVLFASVEIEKISLLPGSFEDDSILKNCDKESILSINGWRTTEIILSSIESIEKFRIVLTAVRLWAKQKGLYSSVFGYFTGVTLAIMVAYICMLFSKCNECETFHKFFSFFSKWNWKYPILLRNIQENSDISNSSNLKVWSSKLNPKDKDHVLPIITPTFPATNAAYNVNETTKRIMLFQLKLAKTKSKSILNTTNEKWDELYHPYEFFSHTHRFLRLDILAQTLEEFIIWEGFVESKISKLIKMLTSIKYIRVHPYPFPFKFEDKEYKHSKSYFIGIKFVDPQKDMFIPNKLFSVDLRGELISFCKLLEPERGSKGTNIRITSPIKDKVSGEIIDDGSKSAVGINQLSSIIIIK